MKKKIFSLKKVLQFKKFQRKPYAVFNSLKEVVRIAVLPAACLVFAHSSNVLAQGNYLTSIEHNLEEIEVTGESASKQMGRVAGVVSVINKDDIAAAGVQTIQELLESVSSIDVRQRGGNGVQADVSIRGSSADQILVLLNGINITDPQTGHYNLNIPLDLSSVSKIEILQGSGSRTLGATSFGGAINIITDNTTQNEFNAEVTAGDHGYMLQNASASLVFKSLSNFVSFSHQRSEGYMDNTDFDLINAYLHTAYTSKKAGKIQFQFGYQDKGYGANNFYSFAYPNQYEKLRAFFSALSWDKEITAKTTLNSQIYWRELHDRFELFRNFENPAPFYKNHNYHQTDITGIQLKLNRVFSYGKTTLGAGIRNEHIFSNVLGEPMNKTRKVPFEKDVVFTHAKNRFLVNIFADQVFYAGKFTLAGGVNFNYNNDYNTNFSGGLDVDYNLFPKTKLYLSANHAYRLPTFTDLYYTSATHISNPEIKPEKATVIETGIKYSGKGLKANASVFYRMSNDVIDWIKMPDSTRWESRNHTDINALGCDASLQYVFQKFFIQKISLSYSFLTQDKSSGIFDSKYALDYLKHKISIGINHVIYKKISAGWTCTWQDRNGSYSDFVTDKPVEYKPFFLANIRLQWNTDKISVYADVENIFDKRYADFGGIKQAGRWVKTGIKVKL